MELLPATDYLHGWVEDGLTDKPMVL